MKIRLILFTVLVLLLLAGLTFAEEGIGVKLNIPLNEKNARPELAEGYQIQMKVAMLEEADLPKDLSIKVTAQVYQLDGDIETILEDNQWPPNTMQTPLETKSLGEQIYNLVDYFGDSLDQQWGGNWSTRAEMAAEELMDREVKSKSYTITTPPTGSKAIVVVSPFYDIKNLKLYEGTYLVVGELAMDFGSMMDFDMEDEEDEE